MQYELLNYLKCPITKSDLKFKLISEFNKVYGQNEIAEIKEGVLFSETGFVFPIIDGVPRLLIESFFDYDFFLQKHVPNFHSIKKNLQKEYNGLINYCINKNKKTKKSFEFEWSFLNANKSDKIWNDDPSQLSRIFLNETGETADFFKNKLVIDVGSGHGIMTSKIAEISQITIGVELSQAVVNAYKINIRANAWYVQGDLQFLPFQKSTFDALYSSGVIHHTNNTELSFSLIDPILKKGGKICLWLYHPQNNIIHNTLQSFRKITSKLPLKLTFVLLTLFVFPITFIIKKLKRKSAPNYREEMIDLLDAFTPEFRFEIPQDLAKVWLIVRDYQNIKITTTNQFGFSIAGKKSDQLD